MELDWSRTHFMGVKKVRSHQVKHYTYLELMKQSRDVEANYDNVKILFKNGKCSVVLELKPTYYSKKYTVSCDAQVGLETVNIFVRKPDIIQMGKKENIHVPHTYSDGSLCLFYPKMGEWWYTYKWSETLIPWTSLWLYYYEIWVQTGKWIGKGKHVRKKKKGMAFCQRNLNCDNQFL